MPDINLKGYLCTRCGHEWVPRGKGRPVQCPKCSSPFWDRAKKQKPAVGE